MAVDGGDPHAVRETVSEAAARARAGEGPTLVVATARRLAGHHTHDAEQYRPEGEKARWADESDPITRLRADILGEGFADEDELARIEGDARAEVRAAADAAATQPASDPGRLEQHVYG